MANKNKPNILWVAGPSSRYQLTNAKPAGFFSGFWHGIIAPLIFIVGLFTDKVKIYESNNNGKWYDFGFILGIGAYTRQLFNNR